VVSLNTGRGIILAGAGIQTAALAFGGNDSPPAITGVTEEYNGATSGQSYPTNLNTARFSL
jgi:hypothetical protein